MKKLLNGLIEDLLSVWYPLICAGCKNSLLPTESDVCTHCKGQLGIRPYVEGNSMELRLMNRIPVGFAYAPFKFIRGGIIQHVLHDLKYGGNEMLGKNLGRLIGTMLQGKFDSDQLIPIPLHPGKKIRRGYNQSAAIAEGISQTIQIPFSEEYLVRRVKTSTQTQKGRAERLASLQNVFEIRAASRLVGRSVILVDDVMTTGSTLENCVEIIVKAGGTISGVITLAEA